MGPFATLAVYALGSMAQALGMVLGLMGSPNQIDLAGTAYLTFFLTAAVLSGVLAVSYMRRHALGWAPSSDRHTRRPGRAGTRPGWHADVAEGVRDHASRLMRIE